MDIENIIRTTKELIRYKTVRPGNPDDYSSFVSQINNCIEYVCSRFHRSIIIDRAAGFVKDKSSPVAVAKFLNTKEPDLLLIGHLDVVAGEDSQFMPFEDSGRIYGRGAKDMKAGVAAIIEIMNYFVYTGRKPNIAAAIVSDEESGGYNGANLIANTLNYRPAFVITPDPGEEHCIINKEKGFIWANITVNGRSCHPSRPWLGECAFSNSLKVFREISDKFNLARSEEDWETSVSLLNMEKVFQNKNGSFQHDVSQSVPGVVKSKIDLRFTENENMIDLVSELSSIVKKNNPENFLEIDRTGAVCYTAEDNQYLSRIKTVIDHVEKKNVSIRPSCGASDLRFFAEKNIPCINYGPHGKNHHSKDEYVEIDSIKHFCNSIITYINTYLL